MIKRSRLISIVLALTALAAAGCGRSGGPDKSGGEATPITLRFATPDRAGSPGARLIAHFADDVQRRSNRSIRIVVTYNAAGDGTRWDQRVAGLVRGGSFDLALVPSRAWDGFGVRTMRALQAPFLLQSAEQVQRVVRDSHLQATMLSGLRPVGVVGLALVPESLRHPFAFQGTLRTRHDFAGARIRAPRSETTWALLAALGARPVDLGGAAFPAAVRSGAVTGAESDLAQAAATIPAPATATSNVTFFPRVDSFVANARVFAGLSSANRTILERAAADTIVWAPHVNPTEGTAARAFCRAGGHVVLAPAAEVNALVAASGPVTASLERDPRTHALIARIRHVAGPPTPIRAPTCEPAIGASAAAVPARGAATPIDGIYRNTITIQDQLSAGVDPGSAAQNSGMHTITLRNGRLHDESSPGTPCDGSYAVHGHKYTFAWDKGSQCTGDFTALWSLRGGELRFTSISAPNAVDRTIWGAKPFRKLG
jgi:TRAP-type C4-dicarboxylate transport system substrate-binding protein